MARPDELTFAPLGGVGEIGMNLSIYGLGNRHQRTWLAIDLGVSFGEEEHLPGIDLIMPDIAFLEKEVKNLAGLVLTHAHEDHFGAIIDLWPRLKCPIYATKFSAALFEAKCAAERNAPNIPVTVVPSGGRIDVGPFNVEFIPVAHSKGTPTPATSLATLGVHVGAEELFTALAEAWVEFRGIWDNGRGFSDIRKAWLERAYGVGERVAIKAGTGLVEGTFDTIDDTGCLIVRTAEGRRVPIAAGEVFFGPVRSVGAA